MPIDGTSVTTFVDTAQLERKLSEIAVSTSSLRIPFFGSHQTSAAKGLLSNPHEWPQRAVTKGKVTLAAPFTVGAEEIQIEAGSTKSPIQIFDGTTEIGLYDGSGLLFLVTSSNANKTKLKYKVKSGTHSATIPTGTVLALTSYTQHGQGAQNHNDGINYSYGINYLSNKTLTYQVAKLLEDGYLASYKNKDYTIEDKKKIGELRQLLELEYDVLHSPKIAGSDASLRNGNTISTDNGSRMGGFIPECIANGARTPDQGGKPFSMSMLMRDIRYLDEEGTFDEFGTVSPRDGSVPLLYMYVDRTLKFDIYKTMLETATGGVIAGDNKFGYSQEMIHVAGVDIKPMVSNGVGKGRYILEGRPENNKIYMLRDKEKTSDSEGILGDNRKVEEATTFTGIWSAPWQNVISSNVGELLG
jgi:hypothetical protein